MLSSCKETRTISSPNGLMEPMKSISHRALAVNSSSLSSCFQNSVLCGREIEADFRGGLPLSAEDNSERRLRSFRFCMNSGNTFSLSIDDHLSNTV